MKVDEYETKFLQNMEEVECMKCNKKDDDMIFCASCSGGFCYNDCFNNALNHVLLFNDFCKHSTNLRLDGHGMCDNCHNKLENSRCIDTDCDNKYSCDMNTYRV